MLSSQANQPALHWTFPIALGVLAAAAACLLKPLELAAAGAALLAGLALFAIADGRRWPTMFLAAALCLPPLPIALGDSGPHPSLVLAALGLAAGVLRWREWSQPIPWAALVVLILPMTLLLGIPFAAHYSGTAIALQSLVRIFLLAISIYIFFYVAGGPGRETEASAAASVRAVFAAGVFSAVFACVDFYFQFPAPAGFGPQYIWLDSGVFRRAQGVFYEASTLGNACAFFLVFIATAFLAGGRQQPVRRAHLLLGAVPIAAALLLSYSRASLLNLGVSLGTLAILNADRLRLPRLLAILGALSATTAVIIYALVPVFVEFYWLRITTSFQQLTSGNEQVLSGRLETWRTLVEFLAENPQHALFGIGYKTLPYSNFTGQPIVADNTYLSGLVETGVIGLVALFALHWAVLSMAWRARTAGGLAGVLGTCLFCFWIGEMVQMFSGDLLTYWRVLPIYFWALAVAVRLSYSREAS